MYLILIRPDVTVIINSLPLSRSIKCKHVVKHNGSATLLLENITIRLQWEGHEMQRLEENNLMLEFWFCQNWQALDTQPYWQYTGQQV